MASLSQKVTQLKRLCVVIPLQLATANIILNVPALNCRVMLHKHQPHRFKIYCMFLVPGTTECLSALQSGLRIFFQVLQDRKCSRGLRLHSKNKTALSEFSANLNLALCHAGSNVFNASLVKCNQDKLFKALTFLFFPLTAIFKSHNQTS